MSMDDGEEYEYRMFNLGVGGYSVEIVKPTKTKNREKCKEKLKKILGRVK